uniref:Wsv427-like protein n=1 Tax=Sesarmops intermedium nimavirus TaxID=2133796 RepID=A0A401IPQ5_9VIRU|nr:MAG: wsv427-like protein [Sesarmops intermedium nimavirus]GBG35592.1 wsv427-like protein [Sesarmops intermedium nimavirus]
MEQIIQMVDFLHDVTVKQKITDFLCPAATAKNINGKRRKYDSSGKWTPKKYTNIDLVVTNCQEESTKVASSLLKTLEYWEKNVIPHLVQRKAGRADTYLKTAVVGVARCCVSNSLTPGITTRAEKRFINYDNDSDICNILTKTTPRTEEQDDNIPPEIGEEAVEAVSQAIYKHWKTTYKSVKNKKFGSTIAFVRAWKNIAERYLEYPVHSDRDVQLHHLVHNTATAEKHAIDGTLLYPVNTDASVITSDYAFKLLSELVLSPHINVEWKIALCKFMEKDVTKMLSGFETDITKSAADIICGGEMTCEYGPKPVKECLKLYGPKFNPSRIMPRAANFWDFCRGGSSPSEIKFCLMFNEPSCNPVLSSGAGLFGVFTGGDKKNEEDEEVSVALNSLRNLLGLEETESSISTRRWREEGSVVCFNFCPLTIAGANLGYGEQRYKKTMSAGFWIKTVQRSITDSVKRKRNSADKGSRTSDLLSDGGSLSLTTVAFGCSDMLKQVTGISTFNVRVNYQDPIQANACGADRLYGSQRIVSHSFPCLL